MVFPSDPIASAVQADEYVSVNFGNNLSNRKVIAPIDNEHFALLAGAESSFSEDSLLFTQRDSIPLATLDRLEAISASNPSMYVAAPSASISSSVIDQLSGCCQARVPDLSGDIHTASVRLAEYRDFDTGFGGGMDKSNIAGSSAAGYFNFIIVNPDNVDTGVAALPLAHSAKFGPVFHTDKDSLPDVTKEEIKRLHPNGIPAVNNAQALLVGDISDEVESYRRKWV